MADAGRVDDLLLALFAGVAFGVTGTASSAPSQPKLLPGTQYPQ